MHGIARFQPVPTGAGMRRHRLGARVGQTALLAIALGAPAFGTAHAQNRVANPGFEYGAGAWYGLAASSAVPYTGTACGSVFLPAFAGNAGQYLTGKLHAGQTYTASVWFRQPVGGGTFRVRMQLNYNDSGGSHAMTIFDTNTLTLSWSQYTANFTVNATGTLAEVGISFRNLTNIGQTLYLDDVSITGGSALDVPGPGRVALALDGVRPNPSSGDRLELTFTLPTPDAARIELLDVNGRRVAEREVGSLGAGRHTLDLAGGRRVEPGLYFARLWQAGASRTVRVAVVH